MPVHDISQVEFGEELPTFAPDTSLENVRRFCHGTERDVPRFTSHEGAQALGLPGAIVPGIMSQGFLAAMIHRWAPNGRIMKIDTVFRAPVLVDKPHAIAGVVTDIDETTRTVETDITITNAKGETRVFGTATVHI